MRWAMAMAVALVMVATSTSAFASFAADGLLDTDWGVHLGYDLGGYGRSVTPWDAPLPGDGSYLLDYHVEQDGKAADDYTTGDRLGNPPYTGGEWYDVEALYVNLRTQAHSATQVEVTSIRWALVTSYNYYDPYYGLSTVHAPSYNPFPTLALDLNAANSTITGSLGTSTSGWEYGITMADSVSTSASGLVDTRGIVSSTGYTARLWNASNWKDATRPPAHDPVPVDITTGTQVAGASSASNYWGLAYEADGSTPYLESASSASVKKGQEYGWLQQYTGYDHAHNWVWEGEISTAGKGVYASIDPTEWGAFYAMSCANDYGDGIGAGYGAPPVPEPASMALLALAVGSIGAGLRRRKAR